MITPIQVINFAASAGEDGETEEDVMGELTLLRKRQHEEDERLRRLVHGSGTGRPKSAEFEFAARTILATGCSARAAQDQMLVAAGLFLTNEKYEEFEREVPAERWFRSQRKGLGYEAWLYSMLRVAQCHEILQYGFDETSLDGTPTLNQWVLVQEGTGAPSVITIECCGLMVGSTSEEIVEHIRAAWAIGQECVDLVREELGPILADVYVPIVAGGVQLHKLQGVMHDTCNTANKLLDLSSLCAIQVGSCFLGTRIGSCLLKLTNRGLTFCAGTTYAISHGRFQ